MGSRSLSLRALEQLYRERHTAFARVALALLGDPERAHDAVQDAFARAIRRRRGFRGESSPETWVFALLVNVCRDAQRRPAPLPVADMSEGQSPGHVRNGQAKEWPELHAAVAALPARQRAAVFLRYFADLDYDSIATALGIERGTVAASLHAAHANLRTTLEEGEER
jgi:RNA polymerase sigma-70 factor (ECF subfamily)